MQDKTTIIKNILMGKSENQLKQLLIDISNRFPDSYELILRWQSNEGQIDVTGEIALELWEKVEMIIDRFNEYGGGPEDEEEEAYDYIQEMCELIPKLTWDVRKEILDRMLVQYHYGNSGFDDTLTETCFEMCTEREEWLRRITHKVLALQGVTPCKQTVTQTTSYAIRSIFVHLLPTALSL